MNRQQAEIQLQKLFGFRQFHDLQWQVIENLLAGRRVLFIEKTGFGKSLCFQFPATQLNGVTIVFPVAGNNKILKLFDTWFQAIYGVGKDGQGFYVRYYDDTVKGVTLRVKILNLNGNTVSQFRFTEVFPTQSLPVKFSSAGAEPYLRYGVTFNYREQIHEFEND